MFRTIPSALTLLFCLLACRLDLCGYLYRYSEISYGFSEFSYRFFNYPYHYPEFSYRYFHYPYRYSEFLYRYPD